MWLEKIELLNELNWASVSVKLVLALILGGLLGYEREQKHRQVQKYRSSRHSREQKHRPKQNRRLMLKK